MNKQQRMAAMLAIILGVCLLSQAFGATMVDEAYYETLLTELAPPPEEPVTFPDEVLAQYQTITVGDKGEHVLTFKDRMYELGYFKNKTTNNTFTSTTAEYVELFQGINEMEITGIATPEMQALFYSDDALPGPNADAYMPVSADLYITYGQIIRGNYGRGSGFQLNVQNNTDKTIATYYIIAVPFDDDGNPAEMADAIEDQIFRVYSVDGYDISSGGKMYGLSCGFYFVLSESIKYPGVTAVIFGYETTDGEFVDMYSPDSLWYGRGDGVTNGLHTEEGNTAVTYPTEEERAAAGDSSLGTNYFYVPAVYRNYYDVPEGLFLYAVLPGSAGAEAGLQAGDILISLGDVLTNCRDSFTTAIGRIADGESVDALYWRDGGFYLTTVTR